MEQIERIGGQRVVDTEKYKYFIFAGCFFAFMLDNVDMMSTSIGLPLLLEAFDITLVEGGMIGTSMLLGAAVGAWFWGPLADRIGRRKSYLVCLTWYTVFAFACGFCNTLMPFIVLRFICGLALGGAWTIGVAYLSDFFPESQRGRAIAIVQASSVIGIILVTALVRFAAPIYSWRILFWAALLAIPLIIYFFWLPESPSWLKYRYGRQGSDQEGATQQMKLSELMGVKVFRRALIFASLLVVFIQAGYWGGNNWIPTYLTNDVGVSIEAMTNVVFAMYIGAFPGYFVAGYMCDKLGRKKFYIIGTLFTTVATLAFVFLSNDSTVLVFAALFGFGSCGLYGPLGAFVSEMIPSAVRARCVGIVWGVGRLASAGVPVLFGGLATITSLGFCIALVAVFYACAFIVSAALKETRGNSMENISLEEARNLE